MVSASRSALRSVRAENVIVAFVQPPVGRVGAPTRYRLGVVMRESVAIADAFAGIGTHARAAGWVVLIVGDVGGENFGSRSLWPFADRCSECADEWRLRALRAASSSLWTMRGMGSP